jgi:hypothetical protein
MSMLTIKHVEKCGREHLQQAHAVSFRPGTQNGSNESPAILEAFGCTGTGGAVDENGYCKYGDGRVYVMNDSGSTVGNYILG